VSKWENTNSRILAIGKLTVYTHTHILTLHGKIFSGSHGDEYEDGCLTGFFAVWSGRYIAFISTVGRFLRMIMLNIHTEHMPCKGTE
jgi:hypothetical protein